MAQGSAEAGGSARAFNSNSGAASQRSGSESPPYIRRNSSSNERAIAQDFLREPKEARFYYEDNATKLPNETDPRPDSWGKIPIEEDRPLRKESPPSLPFEAPPPLPVEAPPPLPVEAPPPLPVEAPPELEDDGWDAYDTIIDGEVVWRFYNRFTGVHQAENPRVPAATGTQNDSRYPYSSTAAPTTSSGAPGTSSPPKPKSKYGGYNPKIHGDYDPNADYAREAEREEEAEAAAATATAAGLPNPMSGDYSTTAHFNRFTGRFQQAGMNPEYHNDENKSKRQMNAFFDVDAAANDHGGRSLKAERRSKALTKKELKEFKDKRREKKQQKRLAWLKD